MFPATINHINFKNHNKFHGCIPEQVNFLIVMANLGQVNSSMIAPLSAQLNLVGLYVAKCNIFDISPDAFSTLTRVKEISLSGNRLKDIPLGLFAKTKMINVIDLSNNKLQSLDTRTFLGLENLNVLDLSGNSLSNIPENLPRTLTNLNLKNNLISKIQTSAKLPNLEYLNVCQNNVTSGFNFITMIGCFKLHVLCFDDEMIQRSHTGNFDLQLILILFKSEVTRQKIFLPIATEI